MKFIVRAIILCVAVAGCRNGRSDEVEKLRQEVKIGRLDQDLFRLDTLQPDWQSLRGAYGTYLEVYMSGVLQLGSLADSGFCELLGLFLKDSVMREVADSVSCRFPDLAAQEEELSEAWAYHRYYFPEQKLPHVYAHLSGFNQSVVVDTASVGIGLDNYLGENCWFYDMLPVPVPMYARKKMTGRDMVRDVLMAWMQREFVFRPLTNDLVSGMIYQGKLVYAVGKLLPEKPLHWKMGYTPEQWAWCENNEAPIWGFLIENEYLFSTRQRLLMKYLNDAPYTSGMPSESPGKAVVWAGYRMVEKYMEKTGLSLKQLMEEQDYHKILRISGYRP